MIIMQIMGLSLDSDAKTPIILLQSPEDQKILPIWIGAMEAMSISLALSQQSLPRPLTHDLIVNMLDNLDASIQALEIHSFNEGAFLADLLIRQGDTIHRVDCRPSDGIALAIRSAKPIAVHPDVLEAAQHTAQIQDGTSFTLLKPTEAKSKDPTKLLNMVLKNIQQSKGPRPNVQTNIKQTDDEQELKKLLDSLEPSSTRRM